MVIGGTSCTALAKETYAGQVHNLDLNIHNYGASPSTKPKRKLKPTLHLWISRAVMGSRGFRASVARDGAFRASASTAGENRAPAAPCAASFFCNSCRK